MKLKRQSRCNFQQPQRQEVVKNYKMNENRLTDVFLSFLDYELLTITK
jgi:hypothetical protein